MHVVTPSTVTWQKINTPNTHRRIKRVKTAKMSMNRCDIPHYGIFIVSKHFIKRKKHNKIQSLLEWIEKLLQSIIGHLFSHEKNPSKMNVSHRRDTDVGFASANTQNIPCDHVCIATAAANNWWKWHQSQKCDSSRVVDAHNKFISADTVLLSNISYRTKNTDSMNSTCYSPHSATGAWRRSLIIIVAR